MIVGDKYSGFPDKHDVHPGCNQYNYSTDYIYKNYLLPQEIGIITKGKGDSVQERMKSATIRFEKSCIEDKWKLNFANCSLGGMVCKLLI